jgi:hypothetical protein
MQTRKQARLSPSRDAATRRLSCTPRSAVSVPVILAGILALFSSCHAARAQSKEDGIDFTRSFLSFEANAEHAGIANTARRRLNSTLEVRETPSGAPKYFYLGAAVRAEYLYGRPKNGEIFLLPNYEGYPIFSADAVFFARIKKPFRERDSGFIAPDRLKSFRSDIVRKRLKRLASNDEIIAAAAAGRPLQALLEYQEGHRFFRLEFPIDLINTDGEKRRFQVDTGPIIVPFSSRKFEPKKTMAFLVLQQRL